MNKKTLAQEWETMQGHKSSIITRCEEYARWTLPYIFPPQHTKDQELQGPVNSIGARAVNHLSNKLIMTLFTPYQSFFRLQTSSALLEEVMEQAMGGDEEAKEILARVDKGLVQAEKDAMRELNYTRYRTEATTAAKHLIITGNALLYHPEKGSTQVYGLRDYCVQRDLNGNIVKFMTLDVKAFATFSQSVQEQLRMNKDKKYEDDTDVKIYTKLVLKPDGKFHLYQAADTIDLDSSGAWLPEDLPWIVLTWNLCRGEDYGRGLVEDYAGTFHALYVLTNSFVDLVGISADIKILVDPASTIDVVELNNSASGTYHTGKEGDITYSQVVKSIDIQFIAEYVESLKREIAQAFLLNSAITRDAERVTAEEIRYVVQELELSHGGIYSRFAEEWQLREATLLLKRIKLDLGTEKYIYPQIITGLDSLSRAGDLDNLRLMIQDLSLLNAVPEDIRAAIDMSKFVEFIAIRRGVDYDKFIKSQQRMMQEQQQEMQQQQQLIAAQATADMVTQQPQEA